MAEPAGSLPEFFGDARDEIPGFDSEKRTSRVVEDQWKLKLTVRSRKIPLTQRAESAV